MIRSMTGYGTAVTETEALKAAVTIRSVNHRYLDVAVHLSRRLHPLEADLKRAVQERLGRGRVEVAIQATFKGEAQEVLVTPGPVIAAFIAALRAIQAEHGLAGEITVSDLARVPGVLEVTEPLDAVGDDGRKALLALVGRALDGLDAMRRAEGAHLQADLEQALLTMTDVTRRIACVAEEGRVLRRDALVERVRALSQELGLDEARFYQDVVRLVDRHDIVEELQRLGSHVSQAQEALQDEGPAGKRLDFLAQEMAREANTIGSKAATAAVIQEVIALKTAIERLREQVQNVE